MAITIKEIYDWTVKRIYDERTEALRIKQLTPIQLIELNEKNKGLIKKDPHTAFEGQVLAPSPTLIYEISLDKIKANSAYVFTSGGFEDGNTVDYFPLQIKYHISFDETLYNTVRSIHNDTMVEVQGEILRLNTSLTKELTFNDIEWDAYNVFIQLKLSSIKVIKKSKLKASLVGAKAPDHSTCFIATATFGSQDKREVITLRTFRDNVLVKYSLGRLFIKTYEFISPAIAVEIRKSYLLRKFTRGVIRWRRFNSAMQQYCLS